MSNTKSRVLKNTGAYSIVGLLPFLTSFLTLPIYTRYLTPDEYGILSLVAAFKSILITSISLQLNSAIPRYYFEYSGRSLKEFFSTVLYSVILMAACLLLLIHVFGTQIIGFIFPKSSITYYPYFLICIITVFFAQISQLAERLLVVREKGAIILIRSLISTVIGIGLGLYFVIVLKLNVVGILLAGTISGFVMMLFNLMLVKNYIILSWKKQYFEQALSYSWPIVPHAIGGYLFMYSDKIVLEKFVSLSAIGLYHIADRFCMILKLIVNSINKSLSPNFMRIATQSEDRAVAVWKDIITKWSVLIAVAYVSLAFFSEEIIYFLLPTRYHAAYPIIPILLLAYIFRGFYCFSSAPLFFRKKTKYIPLITFSSGFFNVFANILLIPFIGIYGAATTTILSFILTFVLAEYFSRSFFSIHYDWKNILQIFSPIILFLILIYSFINYAILFKLIVKLIIFTCFCLYLWIRNFGDFNSDIKQFLSDAKHSISKKLVAT